MSPFLKTLDPGLCTTIQDLGRPGYRRYGVPAAGAVDPFALCAANALVGNPLGTGACEILCAGPSFEVRAESVRVAFFGASVRIDVTDGPGSGFPQRIAPGRSLRLRRGQVVRVGSLSESAVMYMAVAGGFDIEPVMGSVSTYRRGGIGGVEGRHLRVGDPLPLTQDAVDERRDTRLDDFRNARPRRVRVIDGPQSDYFDAGSIKAFYSSEFAVGLGSDRMGIRLDGQAIVGARGFNIVSDAIVPGSIQVTGAGQPIVLMRDHQTTGGYPKIATVISADIPLLGRMPAGSKVVFEKVGLEEAAMARRTMELEIAEIADRLRPVEERGADLDSLLAASNLISGVACAYLG